MLLRDTHLFLYTYIRKEAVLSSQIEGTKSTLSDLLLFEAEQAPGVPVDDVREVSSYVAAIEHDPTRIAERSGLSLPTVNSALESLAATGIVREITGRRRGRILSYEQHLRILSEGTEPLP